MRVLEFTGKEEGNDDEVVVALLLNREEAEAVATVSNYSSFLTMHFGNPDGQLPNTLPKGYDEVAEKVMEKVWECIKHLQHEDI